MPMYWIVLWSFLCLNISQTWRKIIINHDFSSIYIFMLCLGLNATISLSMYVKIMFLVGHYKNHLNLDSISSKTFIVFFSFQSKYNLIVWDDKDRFTLLCIQKTKFVSKRTNEYQRKWSFGDLTIWSEKLYDRS